MTSQKNKSEEEEDEDESGGDERVSSRGHMDVLCFVARASMLENARTHRSFGANALLATKRGRATGGNGPEIQRLCVRSQRKQPSSSATGRLIAAPSLLVTMHTQRLSHPSIHPSDIHPCSLPHT